MDKKFRKNLKMIQKELERLKGDYKKRELRPVNSDADLKKKDEELKVLKREIDLLEREVNELAMRVNE